MIGGLIDQKLQIYYGETMMNKSLEERSNVEDMTSIARDIILPGN